VTKSPTRSFFLISIYTRLPLVSLGPRVLSIISLPVLTNLLGHSSVSFTVIVSLKRVIIVTFLLFNGTLLRLMLHFLSLFHTLSQPMYLLIHFLLSYLPHLLLSLFNLWCLSHLRSLQLSLPQTLPFHDLFRHVTVINHPILCMS